MNNQNIDIVPLTIDLFSETADLLVGAYERQRSMTPLLPLRDAAYFLKHLEKTWSGVGFAAFSTGRLCGFMMESSRFSWKSQQAAACNELSHAEGPDSEPAIYRLLYRELAARWVAEGRHLHIIGHFAGDEVLTSSLYFLGFGAILAEQLRDLSPLECNPSLNVYENPDPSVLMDLQREHGQHYRDSPIFLRKDDRKEDIVAEFEHHLDRGDRLLAWFESDRIAALFIVGESKSKGEGLLLRQSNSAQLKSAYIRPGLRRRGIGTALLSRSIDWAREKEYDRIFVEHETANIPGSAFWKRYFHPFVYYSMRYVDNTL